MGDWSIWVSGDGPFLRGVSAGPGGVLLLEEQTVSVASSLGGAFFPCEIPLTAHHVLSSRDGYLIAAGDGKLISKGANEPRWSTTPLKFSVEALFDGDSCSLAAGQGWVLRRAHGQRSWTHHKLPRGFAAQAATQGERGPGIVASQSGKNWLLMSQDKGKNWHADRPLPERLQGVGFSGSALLVATEDELLRDEGDGLQHVPLDDIEYAVNLLHIQGKQVWVQGMCRYDSPTEMVSRDSGKSFQSFSIPAEGGAFRLALVGRSMLAMTPTELWVKP